MGRLLIIFVVGIVLGLVVGRSTKEPAEGSVPGDPERSAVQDEVPVVALRTENRTLRDRVRALEGVVEELRESRARIAAAGSGGGAGEGGAASAGNGGAASPEGDATDAEDERWFQPEELVALGLSPAEADRTKARWERFVLDRLALTDPRETDPPLRPGERRRELLRLRAELRRDLGDDSYDAMLYATSQRNRVIITDILSNSQASEAGIEVGDQIVRYDGERVFDPGTLKRLTVSGDPSRTIELKALRGGEIVRFFLDSGTLGVKLSHKSVEPYFD